MSYDTVEQSVQDSAPSELYDAVTPSGTYRWTSHDKDVTYSGHTYTSVAGSRSSLQSADALDNSTDVTIQIPASHALAQQYVNGIPPRDLLVTITRYHPAFSVQLQLWSGYASGVSFSQTPTGPIATFRVPSGTADALACEIPAVCAQRMCNHVLYDNECQVARASFKVTTTISAIGGDGRTITIVAAIPAAVAGVDWSLHGEIVHVPSGERRTIVLQTFDGGSGLYSVLSAQIWPGGVLHNGDAVEVYAGCDHTRDQCKAKFTNVVNFGGHPDLPTSNIFYVGLVNAGYN